MAAQLNPDFKTALRGIIRDEMRKFSRRGSSRTANSTVSPTKAPPECQDECSSTKTTSDRSSMPELRDAACQPLPVQYRTGPPGDPEDCTSLPDWVKVDLAKDLLKMKDTIMKHTGMTEICRVLTIIRCFGLDDVSALLYTLYGDTEWRQVTVTPGWDPQIIYLESNFRDHWELLIRLERLDIRAHTYRVDLTG